MSRRPKLIIEQAANGQWLYKVKAANSEPITNAETYTTDNGAIRGFYDLAINVMKVVVDEGKLDYVLSEAGVKPEQIKPKHPKYAEALGDNSGVWFTDGEGGDTFVTWNEVAEFVASRQKSNT